MGNHEPKVTIRTLDQAGARGAAQTESDSLKATPRAHRTNRELTAAEREDFILKISAPYKVTLEGDLTKFAEAKVKGFTQSTATDQLMLKHQEAFESLVQKKIGWLNQKTEEAKTQADLQQVRKKFTADMNRLVSNYRGIFENTQSPVAASPAPARAIEIQSSGQGPNISVDRFEHPSLFTAVNDLMKKGYQFSRNKDGVVVNDSTGTFVHLVPAALFEGVVNEKAWRHLETSLTVELPTKIALMSQNQIQIPQRGYGRNLNSITLNPSTMNPEQLDAMTSMALMQQGGVSISYQQFGDASTGKLYFNYPRPGNQKVEAGFAFVDGRLDEMGQRAARSWVLENHYDTRVIVGSFPRI